MTLAQLRAFDISAAWAQLTPEQQAGIGEATLAAALAGLVADTMINPKVDRIAAERLEENADAGRATALRLALPDIDWRT